MNINFEDRFRNVHIRNADERDQYRHHELVSSREHEQDQSNTNDIIYFNFEVQNPTTEVEAKDLIFDVNRVEPILKVPSDYEYAVERFSCPSTFPIYIEDPTNYPLQLRFVIRNESTSQITYQTLAFEVRVYDALGTPVVNRVNVPQSPNLIRNGVYDYQSIVAAINYQLENANEQFNFDRAGVGEQIGAIPYMRYFQRTGTFSLYAPIDAENTNVSFDLSQNFPIQYGVIAPDALVEIQFNTNLAKLFSGLFQWVSGDDNWKTMVIQDILGKEDSTFNGVSYIYSSTQYDVRPAMEQFKKIVFTTDSVPVRDELIGQQRSVVQRQLFDYVLSNRLNDKRNINFFPQYLKWNNLESESEMRRINMNVYLEYRDGTLYPLKLQPGEIFNTKIIFRKKKTKKVHEVSRKD
jgi:hypothetical protein